MLDEPGVTQKNVTCNDVNKIGTWSESPPNCECKFFVFFQMRKRIIVFKCFVLKDYFLYSCFTQSSLNAKTIIEK